MKTKLKFASVFTALCLSSACIAEAKTDKPSDNNDYESNYYQAEGSILFKVRAVGIMSKSKNKNWPASRKTPPAAAGHFFTNGYGFEGSTTVFFTDNIGAEASLGASVFRTSKSAISAAAYNYGTANNTAKVMKRKDVYGFPLSLMMQYHVAPFGPVSPYLGVGYQYMYFFSKSRAFVVGNAHGVAFQGGVDFKLRDDTIFNIDVKTYKISPKVTYSSTLLYGAPGPKISGRLKMQPVVLSVGLGFKF